MQLDGDITTVAEVFATAQCEAVRRHLQDWQITVQPDPLRRVFRLKCHTPAVLDAFTLIRDRLRVPSGYSGWVVQVGL